MKDRILEYLHAFAQGHPNELAEELQRELRMDAQTFRERSQETQSTLLHQYDNFAVSTIDAFFQKVIRSFVREAGLVGDYRLEVDQDAVLEEVIDNLIDELGDNRELTEWVVEFANENLENERAWDVRYSLIEFAHEIFREEFKDIEDQVAGTTARKDFFRQLKDRLWSVKNDFLSAITGPARECLQRISDSGWRPEDFKYGRNSGLLTFFEKTASARTVGKCKAPSGRVASDFMSPENWPHSNTPHRHEIFVAARDYLVPRLELISAAFERKYMRALSAEVALQNLYVFGLISDISRKLKEYKDENNIMLLADAPKFLNGIIRDSDTPFIYEKVGSFFRNYLIDEFQDTSGLQWQNFQPLIVNSLDQGDPCLVVGDVKQAIYRWRGGDLALLQNKIIDLVGEERVRVQELANNYRSALRIVEFNNKLFQTASEILARQSGVSFASDAYKDVGQMSSRDHEGFVEVKFFSEMIGEGAQSWKDVAMAQVPLALERLQEKGVPLKDIAILVRKNDEGQRIAAFLLQYKNSPAAKSHCSYDVVSNESLRIDGAASVNLLLGAMRYLLNTDDAIARAQLAFEYARLREPSRDLSEVFAVTRQATFENNLPSAFTQAKSVLKKLPLIELTERLIEIFALGAVEGELAYLQAFQDVVLEFAARERNDLGAFLEWWEINRQKKSIQVSGEVNAAQIMTIHKSKGLQFPYVIVPFCSWSLDHEKWQAPNLWVRSPEVPFDVAGYLPVKYGKNLEETFFAGFYSHERMKIYLDNLNLLYVALTRAETGLMVWAPSGDERAAKGTIAELLEESIQSTTSLREHWNEKQLTWSSGSLGTVPVQNRGGPDSVHLTQYLSSSWRDKLVIRQSGASWFNEPELQREKVSYGIYMHAVLSRIRYSDEMDTMLMQVQEEGLITEQERHILEEQLTGLLSNEQIAGWFTRDWDVRTEVALLLPDGEESRIDRLLLRGRKAVVVDFKTGTPKKSDEKQVLHYMDILRQMNYAMPEGFLLYLGENQVVEVKSGKAKLVQKVKDRDQLELGF